MAEKQSLFEEPFDHVLDNDAFHFPADFHFLPGEHGHFDVYQATHDSFGSILGLFGLHGLTKFMVLELIAAGLCVVLFVGLAWRLSGGKAPKGIFSNMLESMLLFIRQNVAVPAIGEHDANKFLPYLWSVFFFILFNNLLGILPWMGSPTGALGCTVPLALCSLIAIHGSGVKKMGVAGYAHSIVPHVPKPLYPLMLGVELLGHMVKPTILAFRLFVNMLAGHTVLYVLLAFIVEFGQKSWGLYAVVTPTTIVLVTLLNVLELLVAFLQAYVFTFLSAIFIGAAVHPQH